VELHRLIVIVAMLVVVLTGCASRSKKVAQGGAALPSQMAQPLAATRELPSPSADYDPDELAQQRREARPEPAAPRAGSGGASCH
jgi:hypothetical protein